MHFYARFWLAIFHEANRRILTSFYLIDWALRCNSVTESVTDSPRAKNFVSGLRDAQNKVLPCYKEKKIFFRKCGLYFQRDKGKNKKLLSVFYTFKLVLFELEYKVPKKEN